MISVRGIYAYIYAYIYKYKYKYNSSQRQGLPYLISVCGYWHKGGSKADRNVVRVHHVLVAEIGKVLSSCS